MSVIVFASLSRCVPIQQGLPNIFCCRAPHPSYFERLIDHSGGPYLNGRRLCYADLSLFQIIEGLRYAFPNNMKRFERKVPRVIELHGRVAARPNMKAYLASDRRIPFNEDGIFRHYKALDA